MLVSCSPCRRVAISKRVIWKRGQKKMFEKSTYFSSRSFVYRWAIGISLFGIPSKDDSSRREEKEPCVAVFLPTPWRECHEQ